MKTEPDTPVEEPAPQTTTVFTQPQLVINDHDWIQRGYMIEHNCHTMMPHCENVGIPIPSGTLLIKDEQGYRLVDEITRQ